MCLRRTVTFRRTLQTDRTLQEKMFLRNTGIVVMLTYLLTYLLTPWSRVLLEKLTVSQLVKKFSAFYGTRRYMYITAFTSARHVSLSWATSIKSVQPHPISWRSILIFPSHLCLGLPSSLFPLYTPLLDKRYMPRPSNSSRSYHPNTTGWAVQIIKLLIM